MATKSINVTVDENLLASSDALVAEGKYANRSQFVQAAIELMLKKVDEELIAEQAKLLKDDADDEEWFEGEIADWQEEY